MTKKIAVIAIIVAVISGGLFYYVADVMFQNPKYCNSCHFMTPFYKKWETSTHNMVPCLKCHEYEPVKALAGQFMFMANAHNPRPLTNVPDKNCLQTGCHDKRLVESVVTFTDRNIQFDHKPHFTQMKRGIKLHCRSCHSDIVQGEHVKVSKNVCYLCHFKGLAHDEALTGCPSCHTAPDTPIVAQGKTFTHSEATQQGLTCNQCHLEVSSGEGVTPREKCFFCHVDRTERYSDVDLIHEKHVGDKQVDCLWCHTKIEHGKIKMAIKLQAKR